ncbi:MAG: hypothetical protein LBI03_07765 [Clostridiales bacterium]|jgi:hypothetical protein|nr:hypothetical protein [Clostridiales bacterium]
MGKKRFKIFPVLILVFFILIIVGFILPFSRIFSQVSINERSFKNTLSSLPVETTEFRLDDLVTFDWDYVYTFYPNMSKDEIENIIGFKSNEIKKTENENLDQLMFVKNNKVVCNIVGFPDKLKFEFDLGELENRYTKIDRTDQPVFTVNVQDGIKYFSLEETE